MRMDKTWAMSLMADARLSLTPEEREEFLKDMQKLTPLLNRLDSLEIQDFSAKTPQGFMREDVEKDGNCGTGEYLEIPQILE